MLIHPVLAVGTSYKDVLVAIVPVMVALVPAVPAVLSAIRGNLSDVSPGRLPAKAGQAPSITVVGVSSPPPLPEQHERKGKESEGDQVVVATRTQARSVAACR